jgi:hypothetical protein
MAVTHFDSRGPWLDSLDLWKQLARDTASDPACRVALGTLRDRAAEAVAARAETVLDKFDRPIKHLPTTDRQAYVSVATYWWPDPAKPDGLPYIVRDGQFSPDLPLYDLQPWTRTESRCRALATAEIVLPDQGFTSHLNRNLHAWFIAPDTAMRPHLDHAQFTPGLDTGRMVGVIDFSIRLPLLLDRLATLRAIRPGAIDSQTALGLDDWIARFYAWCRSPAVWDWHVKMYFDILASTLALWVGETGVARERIQRVFESRMVPQIEPDGSQPHEMKRTRSLQYAVMNTIGFMRLARIGDAVGVDLWNKQTADGRSLKQAAKFVVDRLDRWPGQQIEPIAPERFDMFKLMVARAYPDLLDPPAGARAVELLAESHPWK